MFEFTERSGGGAAVFTVSSLTTMNEWFGRNKKVTVGTRMRVSERLRM